jgi:hypothetical protein
MLTRRRQLVAKVESVEGTAESVAAADAKLLAYEPKISFDPGMFSRDPARMFHSRLAKVTGKRPGACTFRLEMRGSGTATTEPEWSKLLKACGFKVGSLFTIAIGAITNGPFVHGEIISGGTSNARGRVIMKTATGTTPLYYVSISGTFQNGEVITGATSGATATSSGAPSAAGKAWEPVSYYSTHVPTLTMATYEDGVRKVLSGCRGRVKFNFKAGEPVMMDFEFNGVEAGITDATMLAGIAHETTIPPAFLNAAFTIDSVVAKVSEIEIDVASRLVPRDSISAVRGILSYIITDREINGSFDPEMMLVATHDFHSKWFSATEMVLDAMLGSTTGNKFRFYGAKAQYMKVDDESREGLQLAKTQFCLNGSLENGDDEMVILAL